MQSSKSISQVLDALLPHLIDADDDFLGGLKVRDILENITGDLHDVNALQYHLSNKYRDDKSVEADPNDGRESIYSDGADSHKAGVDICNYGPATCKVKMENGELIDAFTGDTNMSFIRFCDVTNRDPNNLEKIFTPAKFGDLEGTEVDESVDRSTRPRRMPNESNFNALVEEGGSKERAIFLTKENTDTLQPSPKARGQEVAGHVRTRLRLDAKLMGVRAQQCKVAKKCPSVTFTLAKEVERLTERMKFRRQTYEKSQHSEWLQETEVYEKLVNAVEQYRQLKARDTERSPIEGDSACF
ncbi:Dynein heavy chain 5, axonemal [Echinococcus multilocularis]|uniref:Dynein heavy chain 5, axonemal n=1 Tax=Echinococcus multilocularis TaxID=6211 RepID=A0A0S4MNB9_ECHMU|nr:Dynein heavy chain 5, axonemal [Echinococcus multilocularis]